MSQLTRDELRTATRPWTWIETKDCLDLHIHDSQGRPVHAWIEKRLPYCDRGHWIFQVNGPLDLDWQDCFPRYFMSLERGQAEAEAWLRWRLFGERGDG